MQSRRVDLLHRAWRLSSGCRSATTGRTTRPSVWADWDHDANQNVDGIVRQNATGELWVYPGSGQRDPISEPRFRIGAGWGNYTSFDVADWDQDSHQDVLARDDSTGALWLYPGESRQVPSSQERVKIGHGATGYAPFGVADWNGDTHQDLILRWDANGDLWLYPGESKRGYSSVPRELIGSGW